MELESIWSQSSTSEIEEHISDYLAILDNFVQLIEIQSKMDLESLQKSCNIRLSPHEQSLFIDAQEMSYKQMFIFYGFENKILRSFLNNYDKNFSTILDKKLEQMVKEKRFIA